VAQLIIDYFAYTAHPVASARHAACRVAHRRQHRLRHASGCLGTSRGSSSTTFSYTTRSSASARRVARRVARCVARRTGSSSTTSPTPRFRVPQHITARLAAHRRLLHLHRASGCLGTSRASSRGSSSTTPCAATSSATLALLQPCRALRLLVSWQHWLYFEYAVHRRDVVFRSHRVDHSSRLVFQTSREWQSHP
jgi:hypothetical protein